MGEVRSIIRSMENAPEEAFVADCVVLGGGPAGAALSGLLARWGRRVVLLHATERGGGLAEETLVPSASGVIERLGLGESIEEAGGIGLGRQGGIWESRELVWRDLRDEDRGRQLRRGSLDAALLERAGEAGALVVEIARIDGPLTDGEPVRGETKAGTPFLVETEVVACATGRMTPNSLVEHEVEAELPETLCISANVPDPEGDRDGSVIEAVGEGWLWWLPCIGGGANLALFADSEEVRERGREEVWRSALAGACGPASGILVQPDTGTIATAVLRRSLSRALLVGDAAAALDPLSSQGIEKAITSAEDAAYAVNTLLEEPALTEALQERRHAWEREVFRAHARTTLETYAKVERFADDPFWSRRRAALSDWSRERQVLAPTSRLTRSDRVRQVQTLLRKDRRFVEATGLQVSGDTQTLNHLHGMEVGALLELFDTPCSASASIERAGSDARFYTSSRAGISLAIDELVARGFLVEAP